MIILYDKMDHLFSQQLSFSIIGFHDFGGINASCRPFLCLPLSEESGNYCVEHFSEVIRVFFIRVFSKCQYHKGFLPRFCFLVLIQESTYIELGLVSSLNRERQGTIWNNGAKWSLQTRRRFRLKLQRRVARR